MQHIFFLPVCHCLPKDEADNVNGNGNLPSNAEIHQSENSDDVYPGVSPPSKRQKV